MDIINIPGAYLHIDIYEHEIILLEGSLEEMMSLIYKNMYSKFVVINSKGGSILYVKIQKALYGLLGGELLLYKMLEK